MFLNGWRKQPFRNRSSLRHLLLATCPGWVMDPSHSDKMLQADKIVIFYFPPVLCHHKISSDVFVLASIYYESAEPDLQNG